MLKPPSKRLVGAGIILAVVVTIPAALWFSLTYEPPYYRKMVALSQAQRALRAKHFVAQSLQLRNDIVNEPVWEAVFSDQEVNAWLAQDLVEHFADQLPPEVHDPRLLFEMDRVVLAFQLEKRGVQSVITVVARPRIPSRNTVELTLEKIRAGILPVPADNVLDQIVDHARLRGVDVSWHKREGYPVVVMHYTPSLTREDIQLEEVEIRNGQIRLAGRSDRTRGAFIVPQLPSRNLLQTTFPRRKTQSEPAAPSPSEQRRSTSPTS